MIAIHRTGGLFTERWIDYCKTNNIDYELVNLYDNDVIKNAEQYSAVLWHFSHYKINDHYFARNILKAIEKKGVPVFPNDATSYHFDDKVAQKYLLEAVEAPVIPTYAFYDKESAQEWLASTKTLFPKVFKLKGGAGSANVYLVNDKHQAKKIINKAFGKGFSQFNRFRNLKQKLSKFRFDISSCKALLKAMYYTIVSSPYSRKKGREVDYVYFQDFVPNNTFDHRIIVVDDKAFAIQRGVRENDFRASGSGKIEYSPNLFSNKALQLAFDIATKVQSQCIAFDFVYDSSNEPLIVELGYGFTPSAYDNCTGYWDKELHFHKGKFNPYGWIIEKLSADQ